MSSKGVSQNIRSRMKNFEQAPTTDQISQTQKSKVETSQPETTTKPTPPPRPRVQEESFTKVSQESVQQQSGGDGLTKVSQQVSKKKLERGTKPPKQTKPTKTTETPPTLPPRPQRQTTTTTSTPPTTDTTPQQTTTTSPPQTTITTSTPPTTDTTPQQTTTTSPPPQTTPSTSETGKTTSKAPPFKGEVVSSTSGTGPNRAKTLVEDLKQQSPAIRQHLESLESQGVKIDLVKKDPQMKTGAYFSAPSNTVRIQDSLDDTKSRDQILFESCNAQLRTQYQAMQDGVKNGTMSLGEYGLQKASTEFLATMKYSELLLSTRSPEEITAFTTAVKDGTALPQWTTSIPPLALNQLKWAEKTAPGYLENPNGQKLESLKQSFLAEPHSTTAGPYSSAGLSTPEMYSFEELGRKTSGGVRSMLLDKFYPLTQTQMNLMGEKGKALSQQKKQFNEELTKLLPNTLDNFTATIVRKSDNTEITVGQTAKLNGFMGALDSLGTQFPQFSQQLNELKPSQTIQNFVSNVMPQIQDFQQNPGKYTIKRD